MNTNVVQVTTFFLFLKKHVKIILLVGLPLYGILINQIPLYGGLNWILNIGSLTIGAMLSMPFFYDKSMYQYEWFTIPFFMIISNLIFWIPTAIIINRYLEKRKTNIQ